jgi:uncharacterized membrane protein
MEEQRPETLKENRSYLLKSQIAKKAYEIFHEHTSSGYAGLCLTRSNPFEIKALYGLTSPIIWLNNQKNEEHATAGTLSEIKSKVKNFLKDKEKRFVLIDRVDYLINLHGFNDFLKMIYSINDLIAINDSILMVSINPSTLTDTQLALLEQELEIISEGIIENNPILNDDLHEILAFIDNNEKVTFKAVSKEFAITKTTTRKRINNLLDKSLVTISKNGRNKIVRITEEGREKI